MKTNCYKNKYRQEICDSLGKIRNTCDLKILLALVTIYTKCDNGDLNETEVEKVLLIGKIMRSKMVSSEDISFLFSMIKSIEKLNLEHAEGTAV